jgi:NitT/TauT family transport system substrate-binding protein
VPLDPSALSRRRFLGLGAGVGAAVLLGGCGDDSRASAPSARGSGSAQAMTIRTCVYAKNHASSPLFWQQFAPEGVTVEVTPIASSAEVQSGLESGQFDAGLMGVYNTISAGSETISSKLVGMVSRQGLGLIGRKGEVEDVASLRGKTVAVPPPGVQVLVLTQMLEGAGLELDRDVRAVPLGYADHPAALERGDVQAYIGTEPLCTQSVVSGVGARVPGAYDTPLGDFNTGLWASSRALEDRDKTRLIVRMQKDAAEHLTPGGKNDPEIWRDLLVMQFGYDEKVYEEVLSNVGAEWRFDDRRREQFEAAGAVLLEQGTISSEPDYEAFYAPEYWDV